jgi:L-threonylcarbamoyladenylate synthase
MPIDQIIKGDIGVLPTDTIYGIVCSVSAPTSVQRIYDIKQRSYEKPFILLISDLHQLEVLKMQINPAQEKVLRTVWPGPISVIIPCPDPGLQYLHRGTNSLAVRMPKPEWLRQMIEQTGPIIATSANISEQPTPNDIATIQEHLPGLDFYIEGTVGTQPSQLFRIDDKGVLEPVNRRDVSS